MLSVLMLALALAQSSPDAGAPTPPAGSEALVGNGAVPSAGTAPPVSPPASQALSPPDAGAAAELAADPLLLKVLLEKSILTQAEYEAAVSGLPPPDEGRSPLMSKWAASLYGFLEIDTVVASTQSSYEQPANLPLARPGTYEGDHPRVTLSARNSRFGLKLSTPAVNGYRANAVFEMDLLGNALTPTTDLMVFSGAGPRVRHLAISVETPFVDVLLGQWWNLFGWQPNFFPTSVEIQGVIGELNSRAPQLRLSHLFKSPSANVEVAAAIARPADRLYGVPDVQAGVRVALNRRKALRTSSATATRSDAMMFGVSSVLRRFDAPAGVTSAWGWGVSLDALVPIITGSLERRANALTGTVSFVTGAGIADFQSGFTAGVGASGPVDPGLVTLAGGALHPVAWRTFRVGLQYYLPPSGLVWVAANYGQNESPNAVGAGDPAKIYTVSRLGDVSVFWNVLGALRVGLEYAFAWQRYGDGLEVHEHRGTFSAYFLF
ncbi:MAG: porin [Archangiaceae bacterium]|nr:porin [Archangiaceae bacterium]